MEERDNWVDEQEVEEGERLERKRGSGQGKVARREGGEMRRKRSEGRDGGQKEEDGAPTESCASSCRATSGLSSAS